MPVELTSIVSSAIEPADRARQASYNRMKHFQIISASLGYLEKLPDEPSA